MDSTENIKQQTPLTTAIPSQDLNTAGENVRRNKRRKPPNYYQSAEYASILKKSDSMPEATTVSPSSTYQAIPSQDNNSCTLNEPLASLKLTDTPTELTVSSSLTAFDSSQTEPTSAELINDKIQQPQQQPPAK